MRLSVTFLALAVALPSLAAPVPVINVGQPMPALPIIADVKSRANM
jgi:hypothetical protein